MVLRKHHIFVVYKSMVLFSQQNSGKKKNSKKLTTILHIKHIWLRSVPAVLGEDPASVEMVLQDVVLFQGLCKKREN